MDKLDELSGKTVVITGASSGAGRAAAHAFARHGAFVVLAARNEKALQEVAREVEEAGGRALVVVTDVTDTKAMACLAREAAAWRGRIDVWINNAGVLAAGVFEETPMEVHRQVVCTNLLGYMNGAHAVLPYFKAQGRGILINNISIGGFVPVPYGVGYSASKFGLRGYSEALRGELAGWPEIHICDLFPAFLKTPGIDHAANYTGRVLRPAPPVYDPEILSQAMVEAAVKPKGSMYPGMLGHLYKTVYGLFPELTTRASGKLMRHYFDAAESTADTDGNLFRTTDKQMETHGKPVKGPRPLSKYMTAGLVGGLIVGLVMALPRRAE